MRFLYLLLLVGGGLLMGIPVARAQDTLRAARPAVGAAVLAPASVTPDTAAAIHRFFVARRGLRAAVVLGTVLAYGLTIAIGRDAYGTYNGPFIRAINYTPRFAGLLVGEVLVFGRYNYRHELRALDEWRSHRLSPNLRQHLKPRYFEPLPPHP